MRRLLRTMRTMLLYIGLIFLPAIYPLGALAQADDTPSDTAPQSQTSDTMDTPETDTTPEQPSSTDGTDTTVSTDVIPADDATDTSTTSDNDSTTASTVANSLDSTATTGNATVTDNTKAGNATSGDASASTTVINNVNSSTSNSGQPTATFVSNLYGDVSGDIVLQPLIQQATLPLNGAPTDDTTITVNNATQLTNDITLSATSGDASVTGNTSAGDATTGTATTMASIVNVINSMVSAGQSFVGTINIYGSLNGDILIAPDFIPQLLADNAQTDSTNETLDTNDTQAIVNNVSLNAQSGTATVQGNTSAGSATSGDAQTHVVIFNLSGHQITASNSLLVFVNVLGQWVGLIVDAPAGTTAAAIGNGVTENNTSSDLAVTTNNNAQITNNITLNSQSGDANVANNTTAGNATTGNASAAANIANISNDSLGLAGWFGILFINVFGSWFGSFGVDTPNGNPPANGGGSDSTTKPTQVISFVPHKTSAQTIHFTSAQPSVDSDASQSTDTDSPAEPAVLGASTKAPHQATDTAAKATSFNWSLLIIIVVLAGLIVAGARYLSARQA